MLLGIEIGGTKLQLGVGAGDGTLVALERLEVDRARGAEGILAQIATAGRELVSRLDIDAVGIGFGGPVDQRAGVAVKSHHVDGWDGFPLVDWCRRELGLPAAIENDCDAAALAEAALGAGQGLNPVFYVTVGTGIGGGLVVDGQIYRGAGFGAAEIGHLRPGTDCEVPEAIVESLAAGWGIAAQAAARIAANPSGAESIDLLARCGGQANSLTARQVVEASAAGNPAAQDVFAAAIRTLGWAIGQVITIASPAVVVVGGGVSLAGEKQFFAPLRIEVDRFVFPPAKDRFRIVPARLGEEVVVHGALETARTLR